jgi:hypothetical protein
MWDHTQGHSHIVLIEPAWVHKPNFYSILLDDYWNNFDGDGDC